MDSDVNIPEHQHRASQVQNRRRKNGIIQYKLVFGLSPSEKGKWFSLDDLQNADPKIKSLIAQYDEAHPLRKYQLSHPKGKKVTEIIGLVDDNQEPKYVVKLEGSDTLEAVHSSYLYKYNKAMLLDFFESNIEFDYSKTQTTNPNTDISQQCQPNISLSSSSSSTSQFNPLQQFSQPSNKQNDQNQVDQKPPVNLKQKNTQFQSLTQQQCYIQMMQHQLINGQLAQFPQNQSIAQLQSIQAKQQKTQQKKIQKAKQQNNQLYYPQKIPLQSAYNMQPSQNMIMGQMINFQNVQQVQHQMQGNQ